MYVEVSMLVNYFLSHIYTKLPRRRVDNFGEELQSCLMRRLQPYWFPESPSHDACYRCFHVSGPQTDFIFPEAAISSGLEWSEIQACLPTGLVITIDPGHVACQYGTTDSPHSADNVCNSTSLSSSGCSSASSASSSNGLSESWSKTKYHVIYSANSRNGNGQKVNAEKVSDELANEVFKKSPQMDQTHLATEAALSVLTEPEEIISSTNELDYSKFRNSSDGIASVEESYDSPLKASNFASEGKNNSADSTGDGTIFDHCANPQFEAKSLLLVEDVPEPQQYNFHSVQHTQAPFTQSFVQKSTSAPSFTAATFAATKFGSTKLKNQAKRPHRLVSACGPHTSQLMEAIGQNAIQLNQMSLCDRLMQRNELHRPGGGFCIDRNSRNGFYDNCQQPDRCNDLVFNNNGYGSVLADRVHGMGLYGNSDTLNSNGMRSKNAVSNPMWSQFEKIRSEFQLKNSQYFQQHPQRNENPLLLNRNSAFYTESNAMSSRCAAVAPRSALQQFDGKYGDLELSQDLNDLWNSQKFTTSNGNDLCFTGDANKFSMDTSLGQAFKTLNIVEH